MMNTCKMCLNYSVCDNIDKDCAICSAFERRTINWDSLEKEYIFDHGWIIGDYGVLQITKEQFAKSQYTGTSIHDPKVKTIMLPSVHGSCLIFEHMHFEIKE